MRVNYSHRSLPQLSGMMDSKERSVKFSPTILRLSQAQEERDLSRLRKGEHDLPHLSRSSSFTLVDLESCISELPWHSKLVYHLKEDVDPAWSDMLLLACSFVSGVIDSVAFNAWGSFANMQTGNTVFIALGVSGQPVHPPFRWAKALMALISFVTGILFFSHGSRLLKPLRRSTLITSFTIQTLAILTAAVLAQSGVVKRMPGLLTDPIEWMQLLPLSLLAFQAGGQIVTSRFVNVDEIPTVVLTTVLCDLLIDPRLFDGGVGWHVHPVRNRRIGTFLALFIGAMISGFISKKAGVASSLWLATGIKAAVTICWALWKGKGCDDKMKDGATHV
ncbi:uncharacterized protein PADG_07227 [Paracoccidioides brasiliensis Pb18]|uniref:DUF1275 domain-containing protein n=1 Tax=Paracoccidioides brasiliensis (strain Pb18) TaxID=502780 RepID=C1GIZ1_PARBD|nr:uncharacterized protein PADG_07227 [Paracoccidioides brasiliensis Pb18]EEH42407.2 hypothetical protein PADG_07227 [Paracoccidioides brasiliensis Pb18]